uniref:Uncharacterized protein n=1 Tax=Meloidogyne enterolobii TaxID=390850 RepID=A0A6V7W1F2_MELEN|nr:unnamed protein product [Meloidogyne enterolobii]
MRRGTHNTILMLEIKFFKKTKKKINWNECKFDEFSMNIFLFFKFR